MASIMTKWWLPLARFRCRWRGPKLWLCALHCRVRAIRANTATPALGVVAPLASVTLVRTVSFSIYQKAKYKYSAAIGAATGTEEPLMVVNRAGSVPTLGTVACFGAAGATAGALITAVACKFSKV